MAKALTAQQVFELNQVLVAIQIQDKKARKVKKDIQSEVILSPKELTSTMTLMARRELVTKLPIVVGKTKKTNYLLTPKGKSFIKAYKTLYT